MSSSEGGFSHPILVIPHEFKISRKFLNSPILDIKNGLLNLTLFTSLKQCCSCNTEYYP